MSIDDPRITGPTLRVLGVVTATPDMAGADITRATGVASGTLYAMLARLEAAGWVTSTMETGDPRRLGRPLRRTYRITGLGEARAKEALRDVTEAFGHTNKAEG